jgi:hypothetical protein
LDSPVNPTRVEFCQIKKNEQAGAWKLKDLYTARKSDGDEIAISTLGKLYRRRHEFSGHPTLLRFVSNVGFKIPVEDATVSSHDFKLSSLDAKSTKALRQVLAKQLKVQEKQIDLDQFALHRSNLPLGDQHSLVGGKLSDLSNTPTLPFTVPRPSVAARVLAMEVQQRASQTGYAKTFADLKARLVSRADAIEALLRASLADKPTLQAVLEEALSRLNAEVYDFKSMREIEAERTRACAEAVDRTNLAFRNLAVCLMRARDFVLPSAPLGAKLGTLMDDVVERAKAVDADLFVGIPPGYTKLVAILVLYDALQINVLVAAPDTQSEVAE